MQSGATVTKTPSSPTVPVPLTSATVHRAQPKSRYFQCRGHRLAYSEFGSSSGTPVLYFHDSGSSRLEAGFFDVAARQHGFRLIAVDRPGIGGSDYYLTASPADFCADALSLAAHLGIHRFGVMSLGAGGIFALTLAHQHPGRVNFKLSLAGVPGSVFNEASANSYAASCWNEVTPLLIRLLVRVKHQFFPDNPARSLERMENYLSYTDRKVLRDPQVFKALARDQKEAFRHGYRGVAQDLAVCFRKLDFRLQDVTVPTIIWQGEADRLSQRADCEYMVARMPDVRYHRVPNRGHFFFIHKIDQVFDGLRHSMSRHSLNQVA
ncbi:MAG: alpha/beta hydrolase [Pseudohongiellaceae bacterium]